MSYHSLILAESSLLSYWQLNETVGTTFADSKGSNTLTLLAGVTLNATSGFDGGAPNFSGSTSNGYAQTSGAPSGLPTGSAAFTAEWWFYTSASQSTDYTAFFGYGTYSGTGCMDGYIRSDNASVGGGDYNQNIQYARPGGVKDSTWHHIVMSWNGTIRRLYLDGFQVASDSPGPNIVVGTNTFTLGYIPGIGVGAFNGSIAHLAIYSSALTSADIQSHYLAVIGVPPSPTRPKPLQPRLQQKWSRGLIAGYGLADMGTKSRDVTGQFPGTLFGSATWEYGLYGPQLICPDNGRNGAGIDIGAVGASGKLGGSTEATLSFLCALNSATDAPGAFDERMLFCHRPISSGNNYAAIAYLANENNLGFQIQYQGSGFDLYCVPPTLNTPILITMRLTTAGELSAWFGGMKVAATTGSFTYSADTTSCAIGDDNMSRGRNWSGPIAAAWIWNRALSDAEMVALASDPFAPARPPRNATSMLKSPISPILSDYLCGQLDVSQAPANYLIW